MVVSIPHRVFRRITSVPPSMRSGSIAFYPSSIEFFSAFLEQRGGTVVAAGSSTGFFVGFSSGFIDPSSRSCKAPDENQVNAPKKKPQASDREVLQKEKVGTGAGPVGFNSLLLLLLVSFFFCLFFFLLLPSDFPAIIRCRRSRLPHSSPITQNTF